MSQQSPTAEAQTPVAAAQAAFDRGEFASALDSARALDDSPGGSFDALRLRVMAAFRVGELDEAARCSKRLIEGIGHEPQVDATRIDVLAHSVVAAGELARYEQSIEHLQLMLAATARAGSLAAFVRGRGTAATCFALLGDPWAGRRLLSELAGMFQASGNYLRLEATVHTNHASVCLQLARLAQQGGDAGACDDALQHAAASLSRMRVIAAASGDMRLGAFADVHEAESWLLRASPERALALLDGAVPTAAAAQLWAHERQLRLLTGEAMLAAGDIASADDQLAHVAVRLDEGHELGARIRWHTLAERVRARQGDTAGALAALQQARALGQFRHYRQARAQSQFLRTRLELEHLYRYRGGAAAPPALG